MPELNCDIPEFECWIRDEYLYDQKKGFGSFTKCVVFGIASIQGRAIGFHALTEKGATIWRLPISALVHDKSAPNMSLENLELWDCFSSHVSVCEFDFLRESKLRTILRDGKWYEGTYMFTVDWTGSAAADNPGDIGHKCAHIARLDNGNFAAQPNNRILWSEQAFIALPYAERPKYLTNTKIWKVENGQKWITSNDDKMFYEVKKKSS